MKISFLISLFIVNVTFGQWTKLGQGLNAQGRGMYYDSTSNSLIVIGNFMTADTLTANHIARWNGQTWDTFGSGAPSGAPGYSFTKFQNQYLFSSVFYNLHPNDNWLAKWSGVLWDTISPRVNEAVNCFYENNNELYLGGGFTKIGLLDAPRIAKFDGVNFTTYPFPTSWGNVLDITNFQGNLFIGGNFFDTLSQTNDLEVYNGSTFNPFGLGGLAFGSDFVSSFAEYNNELYIGGSFSTSTGSICNNIMRWDGSQMKPVLTGVNGPISKMHVYPDGLYVCGSFNMADSIQVSGIAKWDGFHWQSVVPYSFNLFLISDFLKLGNDIYITGSFDYIDSFQVNNIAKYSIPLGVDLISHKNDFVVSPNPAIDYLVIHSSNLRNSTIKILNILGNEIYSRDNLEIQNQFDISFLKSGIYFLIFDSNEERIVKKFVKE